MVLNLLRKPILFFFLLNFTLNLALSVLLLSSAESAYVQKMKGSKVLILLEEEDRLKKGEIFYAINPENKRKGLIRILKVKKGKALGRIKKGRAKKGWKLISRKKWIQQKNQQKSFVAKENRKEKSNYALSETEEKKSFSIEVLGNVHLYNLNFKALENTPLYRELSEDLRATKITGLGFGGQLTFNYSLLSWLYVHSQFGYSHVSLVSEKKACSKNNLPTSCMTLIGYLTPGIGGKIVLPLPYFKPWIGGGVHFYFPVIKDSIGPYIREKGITNTTVMSLAAGFNVEISSFRFPVFFEYAFFPKSNIITAHYMGVSLGLSFLF